MKKYSFLGLALVTASSLTAFISKTKAETKDTNRQVGGLLLAQSTSPDAADGPTCITGSGVACDHSTTGVAAGQSGTSVIGNDTATVLLGNFTGTGTTLL